MSAVHAVVGIHISVGNDAVQTSEDVAWLLADLAQAMRGPRSLADIENGPSVKIRDRNGNTVGHLQVTGYYEEKEETDGRDAG